MVYAQTESQLGMKDERYWQVLSTRLGRLQGFAWEPCCWGFTLSLYSRLTVAGASDSVNLDIWRSSQKKENGQGRSTVLSRNYRKPALLHPKDDRNDLWKDLAQCPERAKAWRIEFWHDLQSSHQISSLKLLTRAKTKDCLQQSRTAWGYMVNGETWMPRRVSNTHARSDLDYFENGYGMVPDQQVTEWFLAAPENMSCKKNQKHPSQDHNHRKQIW